MNYKTILANSLTPHQWQDLVGEDFVIMAGSGISQFAPSNLITGQAVTHGILDMLFPDLPFINSAQRELLHQWMSEVPFEVVLSRCNQLSTVKDWLYHTYSQGKANDVHNAIVQYVSTSRTQLIVTTNYDTCFEDACDHLKLKYSIIVDENEARMSDPTGISLFKIHGSADPMHEDSIIFHEEQESKMAQWKQSFLKENINGRVLIITGYSGLDFEICPELLNLEPKAIVWNFYKPADVQASAGFQYYIAQNPSPIPVPVFVLQGDIGDVIRNAWKLPAELRRTAIIAFNLHEIIDEHVKRIWAARLLITIGLGQIALQFLEMTNYRHLSKWMPEHVFLKYRAMAHFYKGSKEDYQEALRLHKKAKKRLKGAALNDRLINRIALANIHQDNLNTLGSSRHLKRCQKKITKKTVSKRVLAQYLLARARLVRYYHYAAYANKFYEKLALTDKEKTAIEARRTKHYQKAKALLEKAAEVYTEIGDYRERSACFLFASIMGINLDNYYSALIQSQAAYNHLGFHAGKMMLIRNSFRNKQELTDFEKAQFYKTRMIAELFGMDSICDTLKFEQERLQLTEAELMAAYIAISGSSPV